ncbi:MAG: hypothetical protein V2A73_01670 [Pseudomonadota bacterium]
MKVALGISSFRNDAEVVGKLQTACSPEGRSLFERIIVVDSCGTGAVGREIERLGLGQDRQESRITYHNHDTNLGAARNLALRMKLAAETGADYLFAINHDGDLDLAAVEKLIDYARRSQDSCPCCSHSEIQCRHDGQVAVVYPLRRLSNGSYSLSGLSPLPMPMMRVRRPPRVEAITVYWSSSNGALYWLEPFRRGIKPYEGLWHGWEDFAYGLALAQAGYRQVLLPAVRIDGRYEYRHQSSMGNVWMISDKPPWLTYYLARNLVLALRRFRPFPLATVAGIGRILLEGGAILWLRQSKGERLRYAAMGLLHGLLGQEGPTVMPAAPPVDAKVAS